MGLVKALLGGINKRDIVRTCWDGANVGPMELRNVGAIELRKWHCSDE